MKVLLKVDANTEYLIAVKVPGNLTDKEAFKIAEDKAWEFRFGKIDDNIEIVESNDTLWNYVYQFKIERTKL